MIATTLGSLVSALALAFATPRVAKPESDAPDDPGSTAAQTELRIARSTDGLAFIDLGKTFTVGATAPDLARLPNGDLLALFDYAIEADGKGPTVMAVSRSKDQGRTWSPMRLVRLRGPGGQRVGGRHGDLVEAADGRYRLYFAMTTGRAPVDRHTTRERVPTLLAAHTRNGLEYRIDGEVGLDGRRPAAGWDPHPMVARVGDRVHLYTADPRAGEQATEESQRSVLHVVSADGRRFTETVPARIPPVRFVGSLVPIDRGVRAYVSFDGGIGSLVSGNGRDWKAEPGVRLPRAWDPAVVRLKDGSFLMVYCTEQASPDTPARQSEPASDAAHSEHAASVGADETGGNGAVADGPPWDDQADTIDPHGPPVDGAEGDVLVAPPSEEELAWLDEDESSDGWFAGGDGLAGWDEWKAGPEQDRAGDGGEDVGWAGHRGADAGPAGDRGGDADWAGDSGPATEWDGGLGGDPVGDLGSDAGQFAEQWTDDWLADDPLVFAPKPDFQTHVNYYEWFEREALQEIADNAFDLYAEFMPFLSDDPASQPDWPELVNMFNDQSYDGPPGPWDPVLRLEWEASSQAAQEVLSRFREAGWAEGYALRPMFGEDRMFETPDREPLLLEMMLPALRPHRDLAKATLADAWRAPDGQVSPERMLDAWETTLRNADHLSSGPTLIESLVGTAERALVEKSALWALQHGVFDERGLEEALDVLMAYDRDDTDPAKWVRGEHAMAMQTVQYAFEPGDSDFPKVVVAETMYHLVSEDVLNEEAVNELASMDQDDARAAVDAFDDYYRELLDQWRIGYPEFRAADMDATAERYLHTNALTEAFLPSLSRVQKLRTRSEAFRRATQLSYATHLFKARNGRWPESLGELPEEHGQRLRIDPFTGDYFGYRLTEEGPTIYSASENGLDDGGVHSSRWDDQITNDAGSDDYVFWPPQGQRS